jgi:hypothetical protein
MSLIKEKRAIADKDATAQAWANEKNLSKANSVIASGPSPSG